MAKIWQKILGLDKVGIEDDFAELGGHSLMALRMITLIEQKIKIKVNLHALQKTNIKELAKHIETILSNKEEISSLIVPIRSVGHELPMFCLHPVGGTVFCYLNLAKHLKFDCPIYGIQDPSFTKGKLLYHSIEEMAGNYLEIIQQVQKKGPYLICGFGRRFFQLCSCL